MNIELAWFEKKHKEQVIKLFVNEYKTDYNFFSDYFDRFYFHSFQKNKCLLIVALDGPTVAGFQSFFYWPYYFKDKPFNSFQSGNSLIHPAYRGKGIFQKMLAFIDGQYLTRDIDFLMGFPVEASKKNFLKDNWQNILDLHWYVKLCNPFGFSGKIREGDFFKKGLVYPSSIYDAGGIRLANNTDFIAWRQAYLNAGNYYSFIFKQEDCEVIFHLKPNKRKKILNELVIGSVLFNSPLSEKLLLPALQHLISAVRMSFGFHFISIALNESGNFKLNNLLEQLNFRNTEKKIYFIVKPFKNHELLLKPGNWNLYRADIDTW